MRLVRELLVADAEPAVLQADAAGRASRYLDVLVAGLGIRAGAVLLRSPDRGLQCVASTVGSAATDLLVAVDGRVGALARRTMEERRAFLVRKGTDDPLLTLLREGDPTIASVAMVPLVDRTATGVLVLAGDEKTLAPDVVRTLTPALRLLAVLVAPHRDGVIPVPASDGVLESVRAERDRHARTIDELAARVSELESALVAAREAAVTAPVGDADLAAAPASPQAVAVAAAVNVETTAALVAAAEAESGPPLIVVVDQSTDWERHAVPEHRLVALAPTDDLGLQILEDPPTRLVVNLAAAGALAALAAIRRDDVTTPAIGVLRGPEGDRVVGVGLVEAVARPAAAEALVAAVERTAPRGARVFAAGRDADALMKMRQALAKQGLSVSMARDTKQIEELVAMVRPQVMVVDLDLPGDEGYELVLRAAAMTPPPGLVLVLPPGDPLPGLLKKLAGRIAAGAGMNAKQWLVEAAVQKLATKAKRAGGSAGQTAAPARP